MAAEDLGPDRVRVGDVRGVAQLAKRRAPDVVHGCHAGVEKNSPGDGDDEALEGFDVDEGRPRRGSAHAAVEGRAVESRRLRAPRGGVAEAPRRRQRPAHGAHEERRVRRGRRARLAVVGVVAPIEKVKQAAVGPRGGGVVRGRRETTT